MQDEVTNFGVEVKMPVFTGGRSIAAINASRHVSNNSKYNVHAAANQVNKLRQLLGLILVPQADELKHQMVKY